MKILLAILVLFTGISCAQNNDVPSITAEQLIEKMESDSSFVVLDVRTRKELTGPLGKIDEAINIPINELEDRIEELDKYVDKNIIVICRSGNRSATGTKILIKNHFNAKNVKGGMIDYRKKLKDEM